MMMLMMLMLMMLMMLMIFFLMVILQCWSPPISRVLIAYSIITGTYYLGKSLEADGFWKCHDSVVACCSNWCCPNQLYQPNMRISWRFPWDFAGDSASSDRLSRSLPWKMCPCARRPACRFPLSHGGTPKVIQSLYHFSIETQGDLGIPHFKKLPGEFGRYPKQLRSCLWNGKARRKEHMDLLIQSWHCFSFWTLTWIYPNIAAEVYASTHVY